MGVNNRGKTWFTKNINNNESWSTKKAVFFSDKIKYHMLGLEF